MTLITRLEQPSYEVQFDLSKDDQAEERRQYDVLEIHAAPAIGGREGAVDRAALATPCGGSLE